MKSYVPHVKKYKCLSCKKQVPKTDYSLTSRGKRARRCNNCRIRVKMLEHEEEFKTIQVDSLRDTIIFTSDHLIAEYGELTDADNDFSVPRFTSQYALDTDPYLSYLLSPSCTTKDRKSYAFDIRDTIKDIYKFIFDTSEITPEREKFTFYCVRKRHLSCLRQQRATENEFVNENEAYAPVVRPCNGILTIVFDFKMNQVLLYHHHRHHYHNSEDYYDYHPFMCI